jgi:hypothetical protein
MARTALPLAVIDAVLLVDALTEPLPLPVTLAAPVPDPVGAAVVVAVADRLMLTVNEAEPVPVCSEEAC